MDWSSKVNNTQRCLLDWNKTTFGNIFSAKRRLVRRLNGIASRLLQEDNPFLINLQKELWSQYELLLIREELFWFQKSRCKWLEFGDRNTSYFHGTTVIRRRKNRIVKLQNEEGVWIEN
uniref:Uncharacterized protein n=1 Tax=Cajanus cajan TaxID=3821 RepID=A0A151T9Q9_CAJCA|nr:hypothetical protein KK1_018328 [Cajanus cajan]KYP63779.1 hypothetical protein KK1_018361 [Cajanus cajan]